MQSREKKLSLGEIYVIYVLRNLPLYIGRRVVICAVLKNDIHGLHEGE